MTRSATITGVGSTLPPRLVPNTWFEDKLETNDEWIRERTGIEARHFVEDGVDTSDLVVEAAKAAMETAAITPDQLDLIVVASVTGDTPFPATAVWAQEKLGVRVPAFDVNAACAGFSYGLASATAFVQAGMADTVLLVGAEIFSRILDFTDRTTSILFGDGAGAVIVQASDRPGIEGTVLGADGTRGGDLDDARGRDPHARVARDRRGARPRDPDAEGPRGLQARRDRDGRRLPRAPREVRSTRRRTSTS